MNLQGQLEDQRKRERRDGPGRSRTPSNDHEGLTYRRPFFQVVGVIFTNSLNLCFNHNFSNPDFNVNISFMCYL